MFASFALAAQTQEKNLSPGVASNQPQAVEEMAKVPLYFEINQGQADAQVKFVSRGAGHTILLTPSRAALILTERERGRTGSKTERKTSGTVVNMAFVGANRRPEISGMEELSGKSNYFIGKDPGKWRTNIATYGRVLYRELYPGIDLVFYGCKGKLEYDFVVRPGADPRQIVLGFSGTNGMQIDTQGDLMLRTGLGVIRQRKPLVYQEIDGVRRAISGSYVLRGRHQVGLRTAAYDHRTPLIIDPVLSYSTYLGGSGFDQGFGIAVDSAGNVYVIGYTTSTNFPTTSGAFQTTSGGPAFVTKLNPAGSALVYSTYLGGVDGRSIAVNSAGNAYVTGGVTSASNFPTTPGAFQATSPGGKDAFVTALNAAGSALVYSTYLGGSSDEFGYGIGVDGAGNAYVTGTTSSTNFPTTPGAFQTALGGQSDAFVTKLNPAGLAAYSTYLGGWGADSGYGIAVDSAGNAYVTGAAGSPNFPRTTGGTSQSGLHAFVSKLNPAGSAPLVYSIFLGGSYNIGNGIAVDHLGNAYVTGISYVSDFPTTPGVYQATFGGAWDAFATKLNPAGFALYSTFLGGSSKDGGYSIAVDGAGNAYVTGFTFSGNFPTTPDALPPPTQGSHAFVTALNPAGSAIYSTYLGGSIQEFGYGISVNSAGNAYVTGTTASTNFPTTPGAFQTTLSGTTDAFVVKIILEPIQALTQSLTTLINGLNLSAQLTSLLLSFVQQIPTAVSSLTTAQKAAAIANINGLITTVRTLISFNILPASQGSLLISIANQAIAVLSQ